MTASSKTPEERLGVVLDGAYVCGRVWEAWQYGTMREDDFTPAAEADGFVGDLLDWRQSAINPARTYTGEFPPNPAMPQNVDDLVATLMDRIRDVRIKYGTALDKLAEALGGDVEDVQRWVEAEADARKVVFDDAGIGAAGLRHGDTP